MSALLTTTLPPMKTTIEALIENNSILKVEIPTQIKMFDLKMVRDIMNLSRSFPYIPSFTKESNTK
jgi:hypothetical protein